MSHATGSRNRSLVVWAIGLLVMGSWAQAGPATGPASFADQYAGGRPTTQAIESFDSDEVGKTPGDFTTALTGGGGEVSWVVREDSTAPSGGKVLEQTSADQTDYRFPLCILKRPSVKDVAVFTRFKAVAGTVDQAAGVVVRYQDKDNYYVVRANALEDNVRLYKVEKGKRSQFAGVDVKVSGSEWHTLKLSVKGNHFQVFFDDKPLFEADDKTFTKSGGVGLWTKADSVTEFDDFVVVGYDPRRTGA